jgi:hypothetical protein
MACSIVCLFVTLLTGSPALGSGTFISAPDRVDVAYEDTQSILYISGGAAILRYHIPSDSFLDPLWLGGSLKGVALSLDGRTLAVADAAYSAAEVWVHLVDLQTGDQTRASFPRAFSEGGTFSVTFGNDGALLITSTYLGSGWVPLRRYDPATGIVQTLMTITQDTMLSPSADGTAIGFAESNISDGRFGRYRVADGNLLHKTGYTDGTAWFNYEIGVSRDGAQYAIPTYGGTMIYDADLVKQATVGTYAAGQPIGVVYHPTQDLVYFAWATTTSVVAYDTVTLAPVAQYDFEHLFTHPGNHAFVAGRLKMSRDGRLLFATVEGGVRYIELNVPPVGEGQAVPAVEDTPVAVTLAGHDANGDALTYAVASGPAHGTLQGTPPDLAYTPAANYSGPDEFTFKVSDGLEESALVTVSVMVAPVNDAPTFGLAGQLISARHNGGLYRIPGWAVSIGPGPADEAGQTVQFVTTTSAPWLFSTQPALDSAGTLTFAPRHNRKGTATVTVYAQDSGGTADGGVDRSAARTFTITVR